MLKENTAVSIGMPVYNAEATLERVLEALLQQTWKNIEIIISDNASTDATAEICRHYAEIDPRIRYHRQSYNKGFAENFKFVFDQSKYNFFLWAAADDIRSPDFIEKNLNFLLENPDFVASVSPVYFTGNIPNDITMGDRVMDDVDIYERILKIFRTWHANGHFYGVYRRSVIASWPDILARYLGSDWSLVLHAASMGKLNRLSAGGLELGNQGVSNTKDIFSVYRKNWLSFFIPFYVLSIKSWRLMKGSHWRQKLMLLFRLLRLNWWAFRGQFAARRMAKANDL